MGMQSLRSVMSGVAKQQRQMAWQRVAARVVWVCLVTGLVLILGDAVWPMQGGNRLLMLGAIVLGAVAASWKLSPGQRDVTREQLYEARRLEKHYKLRGNPLVNGLWLSDPKLADADRDDSTKFTCQLAQRSVSQAEHTVHRIDVSGAIDRKPLRTEVLWAAVAAAVWVLTLAIQPGLILEGIARLADPLSSNQSFSLTGIEQIVEPDPVAQAIDQAREQADDKTPTMAVSGSGPTTGLVQSMQSTAAGLGELAGEAKRLQERSGQLLERFETRSRDRALDDWLMEQAAGLERRFERFVRVHQRLRQQLMGLAQTRSHNPGSDELLEALKVTGARIEQLSLPNIKGARIGVSSENRLLGEGQITQGVEQWVQRVYEAASQDTRLLERELAELERAMGEVVGRHLAKADSVGSGVSGDDHKAVARGDYVDHIDIQEQQRRLPNAIIQQAPQEYRQAVAWYFDRLARDEEQSINVRASPAVE